MKVIVLTGGGTAGHVTPNIALIPGLQQAGYDIHYIGSYNGIEKQLIEKMGIPYHAINAGKLRRYLDVKNLTDVFRVVDGFNQARSVLGKLKPDVVFSKGGFVSCPVVWAAWARHIPVVIHESDMTPGLTNKLSIPFARKVCYTFPETAAHIPEAKGVLTGLPIRAEILSGQREEGLRLCGFTESKPVLMVIGGSQGAEAINQTIRQALPALRTKFQICHVCGKGNIDSTCQTLDGYRQFEYVNDELRHLFAIADIVVSRAGATTIFELLALKKPNVLIPLSKNASRGDQILNAQSFKQQGFSSVLPEEQMTAATLINTILALDGDIKTYKHNMEMGRTGFAAYSVQRILDDIVQEHHQSKKK